MTITQDLLVANVDEISANGKLFIRFERLITHKDKQHDLVLEWRRRDDTWDRECVGRLATLVDSLHEIKLTQDEAGLHCHGDLVPDYWTNIFGKLKATVVCNGASWSYTGEFDGQAVSGKISLEWVEKPRPSLGVNDAPLKILEEFKTKGAAGRLYDFSYAGRGTSHDIPEGLPVFKAEDYGLEVNSGKEATQSIQAALDAAGEAGGGIVQLPAGIIDFNVDRKEPYLFVKADHVYLRGAGSGPAGTMLVNHRYSDTPDPKQPWLAGMHPLMIFGERELDLKMTELEAIAEVQAGKRGACTIQVENSQALTVGQSVMLQQLEKTDGSLGRALTCGMIEKPGDNWVREGKPLVTQLAVIESIDGNEVTLDAPLHRDVTEWRTILCDYPMTHGGGVVDLRITSHWEGFFNHHKNGEHDNGWDFIKLRSTRGALIANVVCENTSSAIGLKDCLGCVVRDCTIIGNYSHNGFVIASTSTGNLHLRNHASRNMHGFNVQGTLSGNALVDCSFDEASGVDLHGGIGCDTLIDNMVGGVLRGGGAGHAVPPRHGLGFTLWNWRTGLYNPYKFWHQCNDFANHDQTPGYTVVGLHGAYGQMPAVTTPDGSTSENFQEEWGWVESMGQRVAPRSLYEWQCAQRDR